MGDPGLLIMVGVLAVPVGVLLFVIGLAMMGRRWTTTAAGAQAGADLPLAEELPGTGYVPPASYGAPAPYALPARPASPRAALPRSRPAAGGYGGPIPLPPATAPDRGYGDPIALPAARPPDRPYGWHAVRPPAGGYGERVALPPAGSGAEEGSAVVPAPRRPEPSAGRRSGDPVRRAPYVPPARPAPEPSTSGPRSSRPPASYGPADRYARDDADRLWYRPAHPGVGDDDPDRPAPGPPGHGAEPPRGFPYGPYG